MSEIEVVGIIAAVLAVIVGCVWFVRRCHADRESNLPPDWPHMR